MNLLESVILGLLQGVTEFIPVSSSGHLTVMRVIMLGDKNIPIIFDILLHFATLLAVIIVFRKRILNIILSLWRFITRKTKEDDKQNLKLFLVVVIATAVTVVIFFVISLFLDVESMNIKVISVLFVVTGLILLSTIFFKGNRSYDKLKLVDGLAIGAGQGLGILPGISRSGATISSAMAAGISRDKAGEISFLVFIPAILGALVLKIKDLDLLFEEISLETMLAGVLVAFLSGLVSLVLLLKVIKKGRLFLFSIYLIPLGIVSFIVL